MHTTSIDAVYSNTVVNTLISYQCMLVCLRLIMVKEEQWFLYPQCILVEILTAVLGNLAKNLNINFGTCTKIAIDFEWE